MIKRAISASFTYESFDPMSEVNVRSVWYSRFTNRRDLYEYWFVIIMIIKDSLELNSKTFFKYRKLASLFGRTVELKQIMLKSQMIIVYV